MDKEVQDLLNEGNNNANKESVGLAQVIDKVNENVQEDKQDITKQDKKQDKKTECKSGSCKPSFEIIKGLLAIIFGTILVILSHKVVISVLLFLAGLVLYFYAIYALKLTFVTRRIDNLIRKICSLFD